MVPAAVRVRWHPEDPLTAGGPAMDLGQRPGSFVKNPKALLRPAPRKGALKIKFNRSVREHSARRKPDHAVYFPADIRMEERVMKLRILGATVALALAASPPMARHAASNPGHPAKSLYCATIQPGNPFSPVYDYITWSKWRQRGGWDSSGDDRCYFNPLYSPYGSYVPPGY